MAAEQPSHKSRRPLRWGSLLEKSSSSAKTSNAGLAIPTLHNESVTDLHRNTTARDGRLEDDEEDRRYNNISDSSATTIRRQSSLPPRLRQQQQQRQQEDARTTGKRENKPSLISDEDTSLFEDEDMEDTWRSQHRTIVSSSTSSPTHSTSRSTSIISTLTPISSSTQFPGQISTEEHIHNDVGHHLPNSSISSSRRMEVVVESKTEFISETTTMDLKNDNHSSSSPRATKTTTSMGTQTPSSHSTIQDSTRMLSSRTLVEELGSELPLTKQNDSGFVDQASVFEQAVQRIANKHKKKVTRSSSPPKEKMPKEESFQPRSSSRSKSPSKKAKRAVSSSNSRPPGEYIGNQSQGERPLAIPTTASSSSIAKKNPITKASATSTPTVALSGPQQQDHVVASPTMQVHKTIKKPRSGRDLAQLLQTSSPDFFASMASNFGDDFNYDDDDPSSSSHSNNSTLVALPPLPKNMKNRRDLFQKTKSVPVLPVSSRRHRRRHTGDENTKGRNYAKQDHRRSKTARSSNSNRRRRSKSPKGGSSRRTSSSKSRRHHRHRSRSTSQGETTTSSSRTQSYSPRRRSSRPQSTTILRQSNSPNKHKTSSNPSTREASLQQRKGQWKAMNGDKQRSRSSSANKSRRHKQHTDLTTTTTMPDSKSRAGRKPQKEEVRKPNSTSSSESFTLDWNTTSEVLHSSQQQQLHHSESFLQAFLLGQMEHVEDSAHAQRQNVQEKDKYKAELQSIQSDPIAVSPPSRKISTRHVARKMKGVHPVENELENSIAEQFRRIKSLEVPPSPGLTSLYAPSPKRDDEDDDDVPKRHLSVGGTMRRRKKLLDTEKFVHYGLDLASTTTSDQNQTSASSTMNATRQLPRQQEIQHEVISVPDTSGHGKLVDRLKRLNSKEKPTVPSHSLNGSSSRLLQLSQERANSPLKTSHQSDDGTGDSSTVMKPSRASREDEGGNLAQDIITGPPSRTLSLESYRNSSKVTPTVVPSKSSLVREKSPAPAAGQPRNRQMVRNGGMGTTTSLAATLEKNAASTTTIHEGTVLRVQRSSALSVCSDLTDAFASPSLEFSTRTCGPVIASIEAMDAIEEKDGGNGDKSAHSENSWLGLNTNDGDPSDPQQNHPSLGKTSALELPPCPAKRRASRDDSSMGSSTLHRRRAHLTKKWMSTGQILSDVPTTLPIRSTDDDDDPADEEETSNTTTTTKKGRFQWIKKKLLGKKVSEDKGNIKK